VSDAPAPATVPAAEPPGQQSERTRLRKLLDQPVMAFAPWILLSVVEGPHRVVLASALACALAVLIGLAGVYTGVRPKLLDITGVVFFAALVVVAAVAGMSTQTWLGIWADEVSNATIAAIAVGSILVRRPFTLQYAREQVDPEAWNSPLFLRINYVISAVWAAVFVITAVVGYVGDGPLHQPDNVWTNWIVQIALMILAVKFTEWYPDHATAEAEPASSPRTLGELLRPVVAYLVPAGIAVMVVSNQKWWVGAGLVVIGLVLSKRLKDVADDESTARAH
jgi:hypothetical protein